MMKGNPPPCNLFLLLLLFTIFISSAQQTGLKGKITDAITGAPIRGTITIEGEAVSTDTDALGQFDFKNSILPLGEYIAIISGTNYITKKYPIVIDENKILDLKTIGLEYDMQQEQLQMSTINLSDAELEDGDEDASFVISGLLQASKDVFLRAAAFDFGSTFFRPRGVGSENGKVLINGIEMNKLVDGRPQWGNWGGLNDVQRHQEFSMGIAANEYTFGDISGSTNIIMRASQYQKGGRISFANSNRSYTGRIMATYSSGWSLGGWAYAVSISRRFGNQGYIEGTVYDANAIFASIEKRINDRHSLNLTSFYTPNRRGRSTAITDEVFDLKGNKYNPNWGYYNGKKKNSRIRTIEEPVIMLNHYWDLTHQTKINTNVSLQTGKMTNSRMDVNGTDRVLFNGQETYAGGGRSSMTNPIHPSKLPSFYLQEESATSLDFQNAFLAQQQFVQDGQLNWAQLIEANQLQTQQGNNATYILFDDRNNDTQWSFNSIMSSQISEHIRINASLNYKRLRSENFAEITDLLGGTGFLDVDAFVMNDTRFPLSELVNRVQSDLRNPNRIVTVGDQYKYHYEVDASVAKGFVQGQFTFNTFDFFLAGNVSQTDYQRNGLFENGLFPGDQSYGGSKAVDFTTFGIKAGTTLKLNGRHLIDLHGAYFTKAPTIRNTFANIRKNNQLIPDAKEEKIAAADISYLIRTPKLKARLTGYYTQITQATEVGFFFTETISLENSDETADFVQENVTGIDKLHLGAELGIEYQITPTIKLKGATALGQFTYTNNPNLDLSSDDGNLSLGTVNLENYKLANGPHNAAQLGFEYRDPNFWWVGATTNYFSNAYVDISAFKRSNNFTLDSENGLPFNEYDKETARELLKQEKLNDYFLVNVIGGKSWRIKKYYIGFFAVINNVLDQSYKTGGFEQSRRANYRTALEEANRDTPIYGNRYFFGSGTSYYMNVYVRF